jgi:hypothetical protein
MTEREKFDAWCERNKYYREGMRVMDGPSWDRYVRSRTPPRDVDIAWEAWQEALLQARTKQ